MSLDLHQGCKDRLIEVVAEGLPIIKVENGMFLQRMSLLLGLYKTEEIIPERGPVRNQLVDYLGDFPVIEFVGDRLAVELRERDAYDSSTPLIELTKIEGYTDQEAVAKALVDELDSLPWKYTLSMSLPAKIVEFFHGLINEFSIAEHLRIVTSKAALDATFPLIAQNEKKHKRIHGGGGLLIGPIEPDWGENASFIQIEVKGLIDQYGTTMPVVHAKEALRAFCGLAIATRLLRIKRTFSPFPTKCHFYVHKHTDSGWEIDGKIELDDHVASAFNHLELHDLDGNLDSESKKRGWAIACLQDIHAVFSADERADRILLASQWLFDSYTGQDDLLSFIQTMVVLEILLGEKDKVQEIGLGELLRNRCAYLIGETHKQRSDILQDFNRIYAVRSQIVHRGKSRLTLKERGLFNTLRWMCRRVIQEELKLLKADTPAS